MHQVIIDVKGVLASCSAISYFHVAQTLVFRSFAWIINKVIAHGLTVSKTERGVQLLIVADKPCHPEFGTEECVFSVYVHRVALVFITYCLEGNGANLEVDKSINLR